MVKSIVVYPENLSDKIELIESFPATENEAMHKQRTFQLESLGYMLIVIVIGSTCTYFMAGHALKSVKKLTKSVKGKNVTNLTDTLPLPKIKDEIYELTIAFNEMSQNLEKSFLLQKQFSGDVAHELRTPLAVLQAKVDVFKMEDNIDTSKFTRDLSIQLNRLADLINDLLWFSKDIPLENISQIDLSVLVQDVSEELYSLAKEKNIEIEIEKASFLVTGNDALLERVFYNLLQNGIKYSENNSKVGVSFNAKRKTVLVWDTGFGIEDTEKAVIFEPFYRINKSRNKKNEGNGLGLAICKKILQKHGAKISVTNNSPNGTIFEICF
ncbi:HAMP domain-containing sensor histidine kinase [Vallitalea longa]|nr:HAMP domain-containing sensor histidine kinase [Vallitalea longa]